MGTLVAQSECLSASRCDETSLIELVERAMHPSASEWLFLRELRVGTGRLGIYRQLCALREVRQRQKANRSEYNARSLSRSLALNQHSFAGSMR
jgi:hypothetical protein